MVKHVFKLPDVGEGVVEGEIVKWNVKPGDTVKEDEPLVELMTDKATVAIPSTVNGKVVSTTGTPGDNHLFAGANTTHNTMERITEQITELGSMEAYLALPRHMGVNSEVLNIPGNMQTTKKRSIPWKLAGINPDLKVLAFSEMGYDLDASNERIGGLCRSKRCVTTYRFKRRD